MTEDAHASAATTPSEASSPIGYPHDNASVADRLAALDQTASARAVDLVTEDGTFAGFRAEPAHPAEGLGTAVLVHGWPEYAACWEDVAAALLAGGMAVLAYDQRGYSPGVRPEEIREYSAGRLGRDIDRIATAAGLDTFHLVGHDWGGAAGWIAAARFPARLRTFTAVATPHLDALERQTRQDPDQYERLDYQRKICDHPEGVARTLLRDDGKRLRAMYEAAVPDALARSYVERYRQPGVFDSVLKYYRAKGALDETPDRPGELGPVTVPTQYIWGSRDIAFPRATAELTGQFATGPYRFEALEGATHWVPSEHPDLLAARVLEWANLHG